MSLFITLEGGEGCGKSTQAKLLSARLSRSGYDTALLYEPGVTPLGLELRRCLKRARHGGITAEAELMLFAAARSELTATMLLPALQRGAVVVCDRYADSTIAYQGYGRGLPPTIITTVNQLVTRGLRPDVTVLLDMEPIAALQRKGPSRDRFEHESIDFHQRVRDGYLEMARSDPERWLVFDATRPASIIATAIWSHISSLLGRASPTASHSA